MPASMMDLFLPLAGCLGAARIPLAASVAASEMALRSMAIGFDLASQIMKTGFSMARVLTDQADLSGSQQAGRWVAVVDDLYGQWTDWTRGQAVDVLETFRRRRSGEMDFINVFTDPLPCQKLACDPVPEQLMLDLPSLRVWDLSLAAPHRIDNFCVVFAPRAGHHSNIAERATLFLRERGLTRMALVEQKCAEEIPLLVDGQRHREDFCGQVDQYRRVLACLKAKTGRPAHLVAICQPGPLLVSTLILNPDLGRTFGSAGSPMHTEAQKGFLTDFSRAMGPGYIDLLLSWFGRTVTGDRIGRGRKVYDGRLQVLGFYMLGADQHIRNLKGLLSDLRSGNEAGARRQMAFYRWYNYAHHFPAGFIRDTFRKIFVQNALIRGTLAIGDRTIGIRDYPAGVPIWALGGKKDDIAPELQAVGHLPLIDTIAEADKLSLSCDGGHMALFRSERVLARYYTQIADFLLARSD